MLYDDIGYPGHCLGQAQKSGSVISVNGIPTLAFNK
jgi:hypothetical protein